MRFVLVHGAWHGGWCWLEVQDRLERQGHEVLAPTLPGLSDRSHLLSATLTVTNMVDDLVATLRKEDLRDVVLVGHSFAGLVITGVADRAVDRLDSLIYLDAVIINSGETGFDRMPEETVAERIRLAQDHDGGLSIPAPPGGAFGLTDPAQVVWAEERMTPHPLSSYQTALDLRYPVGNGLPASYVACVNPTYAPLKGSRARARELGWPLFELNTGHDAMIIDPEATAALLLKIARRDTEG